MNIQEKSVSDRVKEVRIKRGMNQAELSNKAQITPAALSQIEKGLRTPSLPVLERLADVLGVSMDYLAGRTLSPKLEDTLRHGNAHSLFEGFESLSAADQSTILKNIEFLRIQAEQSKKNGEDK